MARANGKIILLGEHAVVYGVSAIAAGIEQGANARAHSASEARIRIGEREARAGDGSELGHALIALLEALEAGPHEIAIELELPAGAGLGASAAIGLAAARAVLEARGAAADDARALSAAGAWERVFHGNPSGIDTAAAAHAGCLLFSRKDGASELPVGRDLELAVALAGPPASTRLMVEGVARLRERRAEVVDKAVEGIATLVAQAKACIETGDHAGLGRLMDLNQMILSGLFVSTEAIERACGVARDAGALGAKLTGAGGGGAVIALCSGSAEPVLAALAAAGFQGFAARVRANRRLP